MGIGGELWPKETFERSEWAVCCVSFHPSVSCKRFQGLVVGEGDRNSSFKFVLSCILPLFFLILGTVQMRLGMCNPYTAKSVLKSYCESGVVRTSSLKF